MAAISITAANVLASSAALIQRNWLAGATITAGAAVYLDSTTLTWKLLDSDVNSGQELTTPKGIALNGASSGQPVEVCTRDTDFTPGGTLTNGGTVYSFTTAGAIAHDIPTTGAYPCAMGVAKSTTKMNLNPTGSSAVI